MILGFILLHIMILSGSAFLTVKQTLNLRLKVADQDRLIAAYQMDLSNVRQEFHTYQLNMALGGGRQIYRNGQATEETAREVLSKLYFMAHNGEKGLRSAILNWNKRHITMNEGE